MEIREAIAARKSVRSFLPRPVEEDKIASMLEAARMAPSARNLQEWRFIVITDPNTINAIVQQSIPSQQFIATAPLLFVCCAVTDRAIMTCGHPRYAVDCAAAVDHMLLAAVSEGLGTCWIGGFRQQPVKDILGIPAAVEVFALIPTGYAADGGIVKKNRKELDEIVCYGSWKLT